MANYDGSVTRKERVLSPIIRCPLLGMSDKGRCGMPTRSRASRGTPSTASEAEAFRYSRRHGLATMKRWSVPAFPLRTPGGDPTAPGGRSLKPRHTSQTELAPKKKSGDRSRQTCRLHNNTELYHWHIQATQARLSLLVSCITIIDEFVHNGPSYSECVRTLFITDYTAITMPNRTSKSFYEFYL